MASSAIPPISSAQLPWKNVLDYGAIANDAFDCTAAFNAAIQAAGPDGSVYVPSGTYLIGGQIEMNGLGVTLPAPWGKSWPSRLFGDGRQHSILHIPASAIAHQTDATINAALGVVISDLQFVYDQPDVAVYGTFNQYKPVINNNPVFRTSPTRDLGSRFMRLRICRAWDGIQSIGGPADGPTIGLGKDIFEDIEISMFGKGFILDGYVTETRFDKIHVYPYGMSNTQYSAFKLQSHSRGLYIANHPFVQITDSVFLNGTGVETFPSILSNWLGGGPYLYFVNCKWDTNSVLKIGAGSPNQGGCSFAQCAFGTSGDIVGSVVNIYYGAARFTGCTFINLGGVPVDGPLLNNQSAFPVQLSNCTFTMAEKNQYGILSQGGTIEITGSYFSRDDAINYTAPAILVTSGKAIVTGNCCEKITTGSGIFLKLTNNDFHTVAGNDAIGWTISYPAGSTIVQSFGNPLGQNQFMGVKQLTLDGGASNNLKILSGSGSPAGVVTADPGSLYLNTSGSVYVKQTGTGNSGWSAALS